MENSVCPECKAWRIAAVDKYCGNCREPLLRINASLSDEILYESDLCTQIVVFFKHEMGNLHNSKLCWQRVFPDSSPYPVVFMEIDERMTLPSEKPVDINPFCTLGREEHWQLVHQFQTNTKRILASLKTGVQRPQLKLETIEITFTPETTNSLKLLHHAGGILRISAINIQPESTAPPPAALPQTNFAEPQSLTEGEYLELPISLPDILLEQLDKHPLGLGFKLQINSPDVEGDEYAALPFNVKVLVPAKPGISVAGNIPMLRGRDFDLPLTMFNDGGQKFEGKGIILTVYTDDSFVTKQLDEAIDLAPLSNITRDFTVSLSAAEQQLLSDRSKYKAKVSLVDIDGHKCTEVPFDLEISQLEPLNGGIIAIDFGTTATSAAIFRYDDGKPATNIPLDKNGQDHIPTIITYYLNKTDGSVQYDIGYEAEQRATQLSTGEKTVIDNLKWNLRGKLDNHKKFRNKIYLPNGEEITWLQATTDFLTKLKTKIEGHPSVLAEIQHVCITQPARYNPILSQLLRKAYKDAKMEPVSFYSETGKEIQAISESWPPALAPLPDEPLKSWKKTIDFREEIPKDKPEHYILAIDIGGGSTDLSLMLYSSNGNTSKLEELAIDGDNEVAGNHISKLLFDALIIKDKHGEILNHTEYPILPDWLDDSQYSHHTNETGKHNWRSIKKHIIDRLQFSLESEGGPTGIFEARNTDFLKFPREYWTTSDNNSETDILLDESSKDTYVRLEKFINEKINDHSYLESLTLKTIAAMNNDLYFNDIKNPIEFNLKGFLQRYRQQVSHNLLSRIRKLFDAVTKPDCGLTCVVTGRGSKFPLIDHTLDAIIQKLWKQKTNQETKDSFKAKLKGVVSTGACLIESLLIDQTPPINFIPKPQPIFSLKRTDPKTGISYLPLSQGILKPEDGWISQEWNCSDFNRRIRFDLYNVPVQTDEYLSEEACHVKTVIYNPHHTVRPQTETNSCHLLLRATEEEGRLYIEVYLGFPHEENNSTEPDYENWTKHLIERFEPKL